MLKDVYGFGYNGEQTVDVDEINNIKLWFLPLVHSIILSALSLLLHVYTTSRDVLYCTHN